MQTQNIIRRSLFGIMSSKLFRKRALILLGPRQVGKTTLIKSILEGGEANYIEFNGDEPDVRTPRLQPQYTKRDKEG
jgi:predicted AAA+ superfamily ATPase